MDDRKQKASRMAPGQAMSSKVKGENAAHLRRLKDGRWAVLVGWRVDESFGRDYLSERAVAGLEGVCHDSLNYDFGADFGAAWDYYEDCLEHLGRMKAPRKLDLARAD